MRTTPPVVDRDAVVRLWLHRQGLSTPRGHVALDPVRFTHLLERVGALQLDSVNAVGRAHYLTLWSRFGPYDRAEVDRWVYDDGAAYEYWGHEASVLPISHLPLGRRRMKRFPPASWSGRSWWPVYNTSPASKRRVLRRLRREGPLESADFERRSGEEAPMAGGGLSLPKEDSRSLKLLWHAGRVGVRTRRHFRCVYDLAERVHPEGEAATLTELEDSWLLTGLSGNGIAGESHLTNYLTGPSLGAADRKRVIARNLRRGSIVEVRIDGLRDPCFALPEDLDALPALPDPEGTHLICPFDSLLWQRKRARDLLDFEYKVEIYVPVKKRKFGYYVMPILHDGRLVGRLDPKLHRDRSELEVKALYLEQGFRRDSGFDAGLASALRSLAEFLEADRIVLPKGWRRLLG